MMAIEFKGFNVKIAENQEEYETLPAFYNKQEGSMTFCFQLNKEEIEEIQKTGRIFFKQLTFHRPMQPIAMSTMQSDLMPMEEEG